ncbi:unnamed protein product, partial [Closterium sp. Naga37s-1]
APSGPDNDARLTHVLSSAYPCTSLGDEAVPVLPWEVCIRVVEGVAEGLLHLHSFCHSPIMHGRMSLRAVLMDRHVAPKLSNFGMPHFTPHTPASAAASAGGACWCYAAPERLASSPTKPRSPFASSSPPAATTVVTATAGKGQGGMEAADVFAFKVVVFEIILGQHPHYPRRMPASLVEWVEGLAELALRCTQ